MEDPVLNRSIEETRELQTRWAQFNDFLKMGVRGENVTPEAEAKFLDLKTRIAMLHDGFMSHVERDHKTGQAVLQIIGQCIMLRRVPAMSQAEIQKIELDWNEAYLLITETIANMEEERQRLAAIDPRTYQIQKAKEAATAAMHAVFMNLWFRLVFFIVFLPVFVIWGVPTLGIYDWMKLPNDVPFTAPYMEKLIVFLRTRVNPDIRYMDISALPNQPMRSEDWEEFPSQAGRIGPEHLSANLVDFGFAPQTLPRAEAILARKLGFNKQLIVKKVSNKPMLAFHVLCKDADEAKEFVALRREGIAYWEQQIPGMGQKIDSVVNVARVANFLVITISEEAELRDGYPESRWMLGREQMKL